ncbi:MAG: shikimate dehydrogenase [Planctomycetota bacterium]|nr:MAG: shikimate dehydrogenase [Planctomycetota bacterium]
MNFLAKLVGSFAQPAAENPTVAMMEAAFRHHGMDWRYINCEVPPQWLGDAVRGAWAMGWVGFNCSLPHKVAVIDHLVGLGESARIMRAVNCAVRQEDGFRGENTDGKGFLQSLRERIDPAGKTMLLFGAGGAARAIAVESALAGVKAIVVVNRTPERGHELVRLVNEHTPAAARFVPWEGIFGVPAGVDIVVNATSIGLYPNVDERFPVDFSACGPQTIVADVIPNPPRTRFLRMAAERGCPTLDGLGMLVNQGVISIRLWSGVSVDPGVMRARLEEIFSAG